MRGIKPHPATGLNLQAAGRYTSDDLAVMMNSRRTGEEGGCMLSPCRALAPTYVDTPDGR